MGVQYDKYLEKHIDGVNRCYNWIMLNFTPEQIDNILPNLPEENILDVQFKMHDSSKRSSEEYAAYDQYFYHNGKGDAKKEADFSKAWFHHIRRNPHHWQYWVYFDDDSPLDSDNKLNAVEMEDRYILEMICDWWSFSWTSSNLFEVFDWYDSHKDKMVLGPETRQKVETFLTALKSILDSISE